MSERGLSTAIGLNNRGVLLLRREVTGDTLKLARNHFHSALTVIKKTLRFAAKQEEGHRRSVEQESAEENTYPSVSVALMEEGDADDHGTAASSSSVITASHEAADTITNNTDGGTVSLLASRTIVAQQQQQQDLSLSSSPPTGEETPVGPASRNTESYYVCSRPIRLVRKESIASARDNENNDLNQQHPEPSEEQHHDFDEIASRTSNAGVVIAFNLALTLNLLRNGSTAEQGTYYLKSAIELYQIAYNLSSRNLLSRGDDVNHQPESARRNSPTPAGLPASAGTAVPHQPPAAPFHDQRSFDQFLHVVILNNLTVVSLEAGSDSFDSARQHFDRLAHGMMNQESNLGKSPKEEIDGIISNMAGLNSLFYGTPAPAA